MMSTTPHRYGTGLHDNQHAERWLPTSRRVRCLLLFAAFFLSGCASLPEDVERPPSVALEDYRATTLGKMFASDEVAHPGSSGFAVSSRSRQAFRARIAMCRLAEKSLDIQYYIWEPDTTGRILADELIKAANRGVRVRALVDDSTVSGRDNGLVIFDAHPNIEVRLFNPFANRGSRIWGYVTDFGQLNHRMHNKLMVADNAVAIVGGRNIGDHYFGVNTEANFRDLDIVAAGPVVRDLSTSFDAFWNSSWALPASALRDESDDDVEFLAAVQELREQIADEPYPYSLDDEVAVITGDLQSIRELFVWAPGKVLYDRPHEIEHETGTTTVIKGLREEVGRLTDELLIESAYFVPGKRGVSVAAELRDRGVQVRILTNSLASNDVPAAHSGYENYRVGLIEAGVELYELRPDSRAIRKRWSPAAGGSKASLHTKAIVFDRERVFVGSFNLDPRSADINTEMGLLVDSVELARQVAAYLDQGVLPTHAYRVTLDDKAGIVWTTEGPGGTLETFNEEPETGFWERFAADFVRTLPIESQL